MSNLVRYMKLPLLISFLILAFNSPYSDAIAAPNRSQEQYKEALDLWLKAAKQGDADAQVNLGICYALGHGVKQSHATAAEWWFKAAKQGHADAQFNLGVYYAHGRGVEQNDATAADWWLQAAKQGDADAQFNLGVYYAHGRGVEQNEATAAEWWFQAAKQQKVIAQTKLTKFLTISEAPCNQGSFDDLLTGIEQNLQNLLVEHDIRVAINNPESGFKSAAFALPKVFEWFNEIKDFEEKLLSLIHVLKEYQTGFMISCLQPTDELLASLKQGSKFLDWDSGILTIGERNIQIAHLFREFLANAQETFTRIDVIYLEYINLLDLNKIEIESLKSQIRELQATATSEAELPNLKIQIETKQQELQAAQANDIEKTKIEKERAALIEIQDALLGFVQDPEGFRNHAFLTEHPYFQHS